MNISNFRLIFSSLAVLTILAFSGHLHAANGTWTGTANSTWSAAANWSGGVPASTDTATFSANATNGLIGNPVFLSAATGVKNIIFDTSNASAYVIGSTGGNTLQVASGGALTINSSVINTETINAPISIQSTTATVTVSNNAASPSTLFNLGGNITASAVSGTTTLALSGSNTGNNTLSGTIGNGTGTNTVAVAKSGTGTWVLAGNNSYTGATSLRAGTLVLSGPEQK
ncbi:MAG: autotransporter-associated beta strand repeat-containing protein [Verrucomicrobiota bacterium]